MTTPTPVRLPLAVLLLSLSCGPSETDLLITLSNLPSRGTTLSLNAALDGKPLTLMPATTTLPLAQNQLGLRLPATGQLALDLQALDSDLCTQGEAKSIAAMQTGLNSLAAPLTATSPRQCGKLRACAAAADCTIMPSLTINDIQSIWSLSPTDIWAVGNSATVLHYDGNSWTATPPASIPLPQTGINLQGVWASASNDVWAVGTAGKIIHYDGTAWALSSSGAISSLLSISGTSGQNIYTVGGSTSPTTAGEFWHWDGSRWQQVNQPVKGTLSSVWAVSPTFIVAAGRPTTGSGTLLVWDGTKATDYSTASGVPTTQMRGVWGSSPSHVLAVGDSGLMLRYDGSSWRRILTTFSNNLFAAAGSATTMYAVGELGLIVHNTDQTFNTFATSFASIPTATLLTVHLPAVGNGLVWIGGTTGYLSYTDSRP